MEKKVVYELSFGKNLYFLLKFLKRSELILNNIYFYFEKYDIFKFIYATYNIEKNYKIYFFLNILFYQLIFCYKGFRFLFNLPVRGQRTWSNGKSTTFLNKKFLIFRFFFFKNYFVNLNFNNMYYMFFLEFLNLFWKINFFEEWLYCYVNILKRKKIHQNEDSLKTVNNLFINKDYIFYNLLNLKSKTFKYSGGFNTIGFLSGKYRNIILN